MFDSDTDIYKSGNCGSALAYPFDNHCHVSYKHPRWADRADAEKNCGDSKGKVDRCKKASNLSGHRYCIWYECDE